MANLLQEDIRKSAEELGWWHRRMRDVMGKFGSGSPFDELLWNGKILFGLECKLLRERKGNNPKSFPFSRVSEEQEEGLFDFMSIDNSLGYILVNFRWMDNKKGKLFAITIYEYLYLVNGLDRKSIPLDLFEKQILEIPRLGKGWDLRYLEK